jgi:hypothetical protein
MALIFVPHHPYRGVSSAIVLAMLMTPGKLPAQAPIIGEVQRLPVITIALQVGSTEKETKRVIYSPPPGWYVRSHRVSCPVKTGNSSFTVNTVPQNWSWCSEERIQESYKTLMELAGRAEQVGLQARLLQERDRLLSELRHVQSSHHALVVEATARGEGFLRSGGSLQLTVTAELVYLGTDEHWTATVAQHRDRSRK